jgi:hypothetical protein
MFIDLFLSDVDVPGPSGTEVALESTKSHPTTPVFFVSDTPMSSWISSKEPCRLSTFWEGLAN